MVRDNLKAIFMEIFADETLQLSNETSPDDIPEWDSLAQVLIVEAIEKDFNIRIDMNDVFKLKTFGDFVNIVEMNGSK